MRNAAVPEGETLDAIGEVARALADSRSKVLLVDMDDLFASWPAEAQTLLDTFDLSALPYVVQLGRKGVVEHRYLQL